MILAIRTDKPEAEIGLYKAGEQLAYQTWHGHRELAETLHSKIRQLLNQQSLEWQGITGIVVYEGPGSFTGLRIGSSVANALAYGLEKPVAATSGKDWIDSGIGKLESREPGKSVVPIYGSPAKTTSPKR